MTAPTPTPEFTNEIRVDFHDISLETMGAHLLFGEIEDNNIHNAVTFLLKANQLYSPGREATIFINTMGGSCYDGFALIDLMDISRVPVKTVGLGNIVSMGVLILAAGHKGRRTITRNTQVMAHQFTGGTYDKFHEIMANYKADLYLKQQFIQHFLRHSSMNEKQIEDVLFGASDRWLSPTECKKYGLVDSVVDELPEFSLDLPVPSKTRPRAARAKRPGRK